MASKSKSRRRVFRASCILAALIVAGSSFAWFTSKDEVTNRLSASANYGVSIAEDFTPPENWLPGQKVDKNVGVVNTGNIDAFVRTWLEGEMNVLAEKRDTQTWDNANNQFKDSEGTPTVALKLTDVYTKGATDAEDTIKTGDTAVLTKETDSAMLANDLTYYYGDYSAGKKVSLKELRQDLYLNPNTPVTTVASPEGYSDVMAVQAGGELVYTNTTESKFNFTFTPNQTQTIVSKEGATGGNRYEIKGGTKYTVNVGVTPSDTDANEDILVDDAGKVIKVKDSATFYKYINDNIDTNTFQPMTTGLYIFRRNADNTNNSYPDYEFTGYYYVSSGKEADGTPIIGKYFALQYENDGTTRSDYVLDKDTYTIVRGDDDKVTFYPYVVNTGTYGTGGKAKTMDGARWYDSTTGKEVTGVTGSGSAKSVTLFTASKQVVENTGLEWKYTDKAAGTKTDGQEITYNGHVFTYSATGDKWTWDNNGTETDATPEETAALEAAAAKAGIEVENNGILYTYDASTASWKDDAGTAVTDATLKARLDEATKNRAQLTATWKGVDGLADTTDDIKVLVNLTNIGTDAEKWTKIAKTGRTETNQGDGDAWGQLASEQNTFYYNNDVEEGATTAKLVDSVELSNTTQKNAFIAFDFDLNVNMESMQITVADNGVESGENIKPWSSTTNAVTATGTVANADASSPTEISSIAWAEATT